MNLPAIARIPLVILLLSACALSPVARPTSSQAPPATPGSTATLPAATPPTETPTPTGVPAPTGTPGPTDTPRPFFEPPDGSQPPNATLSRGDDSVEASPIGYCWADECIDGPNPPKNQLPELALTEGGVDLEFEIGDDVRFTRWGAEYYDRSDDNAVSLGRGGFSYDPDATPATPWVEISSATFPAPPSGDWVLNVYVELAHGDLSYAWHVVVP